MGLSKKTSQGSLPLLQVIELQPQGGRVPQANRKVRYETDNNDANGGISASKGLFGLSAKFKGLVLLNLVCLQLTVCSHGYPLDEAISILLGIYSHYFDKYAV